MKLPVVRATLLAALCCSTLPAANLLTATPSTITVTCNTITGPGPSATIVVKPASSLTTNSVAVTAVPATTGLVVTPPANSTLTAANQSQGLIFNVAAPNACVGAATGSTSIRFNAGAIVDVSVTVSMTVINTASPLTATPVVLTCIRSAATPATYTPGPPQQVSVVSAEAGGTPFTVVTSALPSWLTVTPATGGTANSTGVALTVAATSPCGNFAAGTTNAVSIHLKNAPAPDGLVPVTLQVLGPPPVTVTPAIPSLSYTKGSSAPPSVAVALSMSGSATPAFTIDTTTLPAWLSLDSTSGTLPASLHWTTTSIVDTIASGTYTANVQVQIPGYSNLAVPIHLTVNDPPPTLTVAEGTMRNLTWTMGQPLPIPYVTLASSGAAIPYSIATGGPLAPIVASGFLNGFAYSYDTPIPVTFNPNVFAAAQAGNVLTGTLTITWGNPAATTVVTLNITVQASAATVAGISPLVVPTAAAGKVFTVALSGTGFVANSTVGIVSGGSLVPDANISATVLNASNILVTITVPPTADSGLPFAPSGSGGTVTFGVCNPVGGPCTTPTGTATLTIGANPLIQSVTSASAYLQLAPPALPVVAPYDLISLFGINFCQASVAVAPSALPSILYGSPDPTTLRFPTSLSPDGQRQLTVTFQTQATQPVVIATAPLLFATDNQVNLLVPSAVSAYVGKTISIVVHFGAASSAPYSVNVASSDPGVFTVGSDGQGDGAVLGLDWQLISQANPAAVRQNAADSDVVQIYATGLGAPDGKADNSAVGAGVWPADCTSTASFLTSLNKLTGGTFTSLDGALLSSAALNAGRFVPCFQSTSAIPAVTIGGQPAIVTYAGWVPDSLAGQYQVNVRLPASGTATGPVQLPVVITSGGRSSQAGVTLWVAPRLKVTATAKGVTATDGTPPYQYAVTAGALPTGVVLNPTTGALTGTAPVGSSYAVTFTATDSAPTPLTGTATLK